MAKSVSKTKIDDVSKEELVRLLSVCMATSGCAVSTWQCKECGHAWSGMWKARCPECKRIDSVKGDLDAGGRAQLVSDPIMRDVALIRTLVRERESRSDSLLTVHES